MKQERILVLNEKGILLFGFVILALTFALGFMTSSKRRVEENVTVFTSEDLERIVEMQAIEDEKKYGAEIYAYKDENGNLMIGWDYEDSKRK